MKRRWRPSPPEVTRPLVRKYVILLLRLIGNPKKAFGMWPLGAGELVVDKGVRDGGLWSKRDVVVGHLGPGQIEQLISVQV
jgi:hypothetical protein